MCVHFKCVLTYAPFCIHKIIWFGLGSAVSQATHLLLRVEALVQFQGSPLGFMVGKVGLYKFYVRVPVFSYASHFSTSSLYTYSYIAASDVTSSFIFTATLVRKFILALVCCCEVLVADMQCVVIRTLQ
jgi:hypothetical protein